MVCKKIGSSVLDIKRLGNLQFKEAPSKSEKCETGNSLNWDGEVDLELICIQITAETLRLGTMARAKGTQRAEAQLRSLNDHITHCHQGMLQPWLGHSRASN